MFSKDKALIIAVIVLTIVGGYDLVRAYMHTLNIWHASATIAQMSQTPDTMWLMNYQGSLQLMSGLVYLLIVWKAREIAPYVLMINAVANLYHLFSASINGVMEMQTSAFNGQYFMYVYVAVTFLTGLNYLIAKKRSKSE